MSLSYIASLSYSQSLIPSRLGVSKSLSSPLSGPGPGQLSTTRDTMRVPNKLRRNSLIAVRFLPGEKLSSSENAFDDLAESEPTELMELSPTECTELDREPPDDDVVDRRLFLREARFRILLPCVGTVRGASNAENSAFRAIPIFLVRTRGLTILMEASLASLLVGDSIAVGTDPGILYETSGDSDTSSPNVSDGGGLCEACEGGDQGRGGGVADLRVACRSEPADNEDISEVDDSLTTELLD